MNMKQNNRTTIKKIFGYITLAMALTACGSDDEILNDVQRGDRHPLQFTATVEDMQTRVTNDNKWEDGDIIGVQISTDPNNTIGQYKLNADGIVKEVIKGVEWQGTGTADITAWYPFDKQQNMDIADQSEGLKGMNLLKADLKDQRYEEGKTLQLVFKHQMARMRCRLVAAEGSGMTEAELAENATVEFVGQTYLTFENGEVKDETSSSFIKPYKTTENGKTTYTALLVPRTDKSSNELIRVTVGNKVFHYKPADDINLEAGKSYNYQIKLNVPNSITDADGTYHVYTAEGLNEWAKAVAGNNSISCTLEADITMPVPETASGSNWTPISEFNGTFDGNGHTITGLVVNSTDYNVGFMKDNSGTVKNLTLKAAKISNIYRVGGVVCENYGTIENCHVTGESEITGSNVVAIVGGVVGCNYGKISACHVANDCSVKGHNNVGGITGYNSEGTVTGCYALCSLEGNNYIGGIIGYSNGGSYTACYSKCSYIANRYIGGIAGFDMAGGTITCYWQGDGNCTNGVGNGIETTFNVDGTEGNTWADAAGEMNSVLDLLLGSDFGYQYEVNDDSPTEPLVLKKKP